MSIDVLQERIRKLKCPIMVGLDPYLPILPRHIVRDAFDEYGQTLRGAAEAYYRFCTELLDRLSPIVPAVKLQSACFEALGADGIDQMQLLACVNGSAQNAKRKDLPGAHTQNFGGFLPEQCLVVAGAQLQSVHSQQKNHLVFKKLKFTWKI